MSGRGETVFFAQASAISVTVEQALSDNPGLPWIAHIRDEKFPRRPVADVKEAVARPAGLRLAGLQSAEMTRTGRIRNIDDLHPVASRRHKSDRARHPDPGRHFDGVVMADDFRQRVVGKIDQPESVLAGGYVCDPVPDENLTGVPETLKHSQQLRFRRMGKIENVKFALPDGV